MTTDTTATQRRSGPSYTIVVALLGAFLDGYDLVIISGALLFIKADLHLSPGQVGWVAATAFAGMVVGALVFGWLTDHIGRAGAFGFVLALFVVGSLVSALAVTPLMLIAGRAIVGLGIGADLPVSTTLIAESAPRHTRGSMTGLMQVFWFAGATCSGLIGLGMYALLGADSWRWMLASAIVIAAIVMVLRQRVPESTRWVKAHHTTPAATAVPRQTWSILFSPGIRAALAFSCLFWFLVTIRGAGYNLYTPTFLREIGLSGVTVSLGLSTIVNLVNTLAALIGVYYLDRIGRRRIILWCWAIPTALTFVLAAISGGNAIAMFVMICVSALPLQILAMALFALSVEPFPTLVRGTAQSLSSASGKAGGFIAVLAFPPLLAALGWQNMTLTLAAIMTAGLIIGLLLKIPETRRRSLESLEHDLAQPSRPAEAP
ncbi:MFS transporter [Kribbella sp. NBC_01505]|uniref:MFS transporter n=1 Tax=Kribbella sp. NBC_01505 TaxID=2903580 RepID=UPI00386B4351